MSKVRKSANETVPGDVFPAGEYLLEEIESRKMTQTELSQKLQLSKSEVSLIINGKRGITVSIALKLEELFSVSAEYWMNLQMRYEIETQRARFRKKQPGKRRMKAVA